MTGKPSRSPRSPALRVRGLAVSLGGSPVLRGVDFDVEPGEVVGLIGCNGAGKTTLLRAVGGTQALDAGQIEIGGDDAVALTRRERARRVATVPQDIDTSFPFTAGEIVLMGRAPHQGLFGLESESDVRAARRALERLGIERFADRTLAQLSGGERQLVLFARALAQAPDLLLLDEPTSHLDLRHRVELLGVVRQLAREGRSAVVVSHDLGLAARACDRFVVLADGHVVADGPPRTVLTPSLLASAFDMQADVIEGTDGLPLVVPRLDTRPHPSDDPHDRPASLPPRREDE